MSEPRPTPPERPAARAPRSYPPNGVVDLHPTSSRRWLSAIFTVGLTVLGFVAICAHAERMGLERDRCLDQLHGTSRGHGK